MNVLQDVASAVHRFSHPDATHITQTVQFEHKLETRYVDLRIQFIGASHIPAMDMNGLSDPYFIAKIDDKVRFVSTVQPETLTPVWNEIWLVRNVPSHATLHVSVCDKDEGAKMDDYIGNFTTSINGGTREVEISGLLGRARGTFWLKVENTRATADEPHRYPYLFDGPIRYSRHCSPTVGMLTGVRVNDTRLYFTWKIYLRCVPQFFDHTTQHWNTEYKAAQSIFQGPTSIAVRSGIEAGHRLLYARSVANAFGVISNKEDFIRLMHGGKGRNGDKELEHRIKPAVYTYVISVDDESLRFSETGAAFFVDFASKHALHSNCAQCVYYSGEFHPRPITPSGAGWDHFSEDIADNSIQWEVVIDNNSGTYAPDKKMLPVLRQLLEFNFPGCGVVALDRDDEELKKSREACRAYAIKYRGIRHKDLQPHATEGEVTMESLVKSAEGIESVESMDAVVPVA